MNIGSEMRIILCFWKCQILNLGWETCLLTWKRFSECIIFKFFENVCWKFFFGGARFGFSLLIYCFVCLSKKKKKNFFFDRYVC